MLALTQIIDHKYRVLNEIGRGGFAIIYKGWDLVLNRPVAIKRTMENLAKDSLFVKMFMDEAYNTAQLMHSNIVQIYDFRKTEQNIFYIIMEYVKGKNLGELLKKAKQKNRAISKEIAIYIITEILRGLYYAHHKKDERTGSPLNIIHRDVTPSNIMIYYDGRVKLTDFGVAKAAIRKTEVTQTGVLKGKISYLSPEQIEGKPINFQVDLFCVALVLYEILAGEKLFPAGKTELETLQKIMKVEIEEEKWEKEVFDEELRKILEKGLNHDPGQRYKDALDFSRTLENHLPQSQEQQENLAQLMSELFAAEVKQEEKLLLQSGEFPKMEEEEIETVQIETPSGILQQRNQEEKTVALAPEKEERSISPIIFPPGKRMKISVGVGMCLLLFVLAWQVFLAGVEVEVGSLPPGAEVFLNGVRKGTTPIKLSLPKVGEVKLKKKGWGEVIRKFERRKKKIVFFLPDGKEKVVKNKEGVKFRLEVGLRIVTNPPGAKVLIEGKERGETPLFILLPGGTYQLETSLAEFKPRKLKINLLSFTENIWPDFCEAKIKEKKGRRGYEITINLSKEVLITSQPPEAEIYLNQERVGITPQKVLLETGRYTLRLVKTGYQSWRRVFEVAPGSAGVIEARLQREKERRVGRQKEAQQVPVSSTPPPPKEQKVEGWVLVIRPKPAEAMVVLDGEEVKQRIFRNLKKAEHIIAFSHPSYGVLTKVFKFTKINQRLVVTVRGGEIVVGEE